MHRTKYCPPCQLDGVCRMSQCVSVVLNEHTSLPASAITPCPQWRPRIHFPTPRDSRQTVWDEALGSTSAAIALHEPRIHVWFSPVFPWRQRPESRGYLPLRRYLGWLSQRSASREPTFAHTARRCPGWCTYLLLRACALACFFLPLESIVYFFT